MQKKPYEPPVQSKGGQIFDSVFLLVLVYVTLFAPLVLGLTGGGTTTETVASPTWEALQQNSAQQGQWEKLGFTPESAAEIITTRFDYSINPWALIATAVIILGYFVIMIRHSDREYREMIDERFGNNKNRG